MNIGTLTGVLEIDDRATGSLNLFLTKLQTTGDKAATLGTNLTNVGNKLTLGLTAPILAAGAASLSFSSKFEAAMTRLVSVAGVADGELQMVRDRILELSPQTGVGPLALAEAMTKVSSTVDNTTTALEILEMAAKGSAAGLGEAVDVAGAITAIVNSYGAANITAARAADILAQAVKDGGAEAKELAPTLANVVPLAAQLGISFEEVGANIATVTKLGVPASEAVTQLSSVMSALLKETKQGKEALGLLGMTYDDLRRSISERGLMGTLVDLSKQFGDNKTALTDVFGRVEALRNVMSSAGQQAETYATVLDHMKESAGRNVKMFETMRGTQVQTWKEFTASLQVAAIAVGDELAPALNDLLGSAKSVMGGVLEVVKAFSALPGPVRTGILSFVALGAAVGPLLSVTGNLFKLYSSMTPLFASMALGVSKVSGSFVVKFMKAGELRLALFELRAIMVQSIASMGAWVVAAGPMIVTIAAVTAAVTIGWQAWKLYSENKERALALEKQKPIDASNLERLNAAAKKYGLEFKNIGDATKWALENQDKFRAATQILEPRMKSLGGGVAYTSAEFDKLVKGATSAKDITKLLADQSRMTGDQVNVLQERLGGLKQKQEDTAKATQALADELKDIADTLSGRKIAAEISKMNAAIGDIKKYDAAGLKRIKDAAVEFSKQGGILTGTLREVWIAQRGWTEEMPKAVVNINAVTDAVRSYHREIENYKPLPITDPRKGINVPMMPGTIFNLPDPPKDKVAEWRSSLGDIAQAFERLANISGDAFGGILKDIAQVVGAWHLAEQSVAAFEKATTKAGKAAAVVSGIGSVVSATGSGSTASRIAGGALTGASIGSIIPGVGTAAGAVIGGAVGLIRGLFSSSSAAKKAAEEAAQKTAALVAETSKLRAEYILTSGGIATLQQRAHTAGVTLEAMLNARTPEAYKTAIDELNDALEFQDSAMQLLDDAVKKYGFTISELGPKFGQQKLHEQALSLLQDYEVLTAAGIDHNAIITRMGPSLQEYVTTAAKAGLSIPENLRPVLTSMLEMGLLVDENGDKMKDLSKLTFTETLDAKFKTLIDTIGKLVEAITRGLGGALTSLPNVEAPWQHWPAPPKPNVWRDGMEDPTYAEGGGNVLAFRARGAVAPSSLGANDVAVGAAQARATGGTLVVQTVLPDGRVLAEAVVPELNAAAARLGVA